MKKAEKVWDKMAKNYDREEMDSEPVTMRIIEKTKPYLKTIDKVLDFGCGTGIICNEIAGGVQSVHALDISSNMLEIAKRKADEGKVENIEFVKGTIFDERFESGSFDVILAFYILHLIGDTSKTMDRIHELLKPGGCLISATPCMRAKPLQWLILSLVSLTGMIPRVRYFNIAQLENVITRGNLEIVETDCLDSNTGQFFIAAKKIAAG